MDGQKAAEDFLCKKGLRIIARNYRIKSGEIDLIAQNGTYIVFVEVKTRTGFNFGLPCEAVNHTKQNRIIRTALHYIAHKNLCDNDLRFDVVDVMYTQGQVHIEHFENAFGC